MRFALIGPSAPLRGGIARYQDQLSAALSGRGHRVDRLSFRRQYPRLFYPGRTQLEPDAATRSSTAPRGLAAARPVLDSLAPSSWWRTATAADGADVAVCQWWHPFFAPPLATVAALLRRRGVPSLFVCHNLEPHEPMPGGTLLRHLAFAQAAGFIAQSGRDAADLRRRYPTRPVEVVLPPATLPPACPHGTDRDTCARALGLPAASRRALFFGYVRAYKGVPTLIEALARTAPDLQLVVAGEIYHRDARFYRALAARHGVAGRVVLLDRFIVESEVACCFRAADLVVLPYWHATQSAVVALAMACGRAVIATDVGGLSDLVRPGETGFLVPPRDPQALAAAMERAFPMASRLGAAAAGAARALTWSAAAATVERLAVEAYLPERAPGK